MEPSAKRRKLEPNGVEGGSVDKADDLDAVEDADHSLLATPKSFKDAFDKLPEHFRKYLASNGVPDDAYNVPALSRFVRVNPKKGTTLSETDLNLQLTQQDPSFTVLGSVDWMVEALQSGQFFKLDAAAPLSSLPCYKDGNVYGIDLSSAAAVAALDVLPHHHVLDLCCAPGAKLALIFDRMWAMYLKQNPSFDTSVEPKFAPFSGTVTGVDVSARRLQACRSLCQKYRLSRVRLFLCDGSQFYSLAADPAEGANSAASSSSSSIFLPPLPEDILAEVGPPAETESTVAASEPTQLSKQLQKKINRKLKKQPTDLENLTFCSDYRIRTGSRLLYDRVIIDAPCTLDASIRHLLMHGKCGWLDEDGTVDVHITNLQKRLIYNGARLLAPGGVLVYSTCSFCKGQNEDVVRWLLQKMPNQFELVPLDFPEAGKLIASPSELNHCVRFYPKHSGTSGMFISKLIKAKQAD